MARKILLADDSVTAQNMGRKILADAGYDVIAVNNGSAALKKIAEVKPELVILDVYMPGYSGLEVCQRLKESPETERIPVLLTVGKLEPFKPEEAQRVRAEGYIVKPFEASELLSALSRLEDKIVPRSEASKSGRFARAMAAADETGRGGRGEPSSTETSWKDRIAFPHQKTEAEQKEEQKLEEQPSTYNPMNRDLRTVVEKAEEKAEAREKQQDGPASVDVAALAPEGLPKDVTPEELAAITAAAAQIQMAGAITGELQSPERASSESESASDKTAMAVANQVNGTTVELAGVEVKHRRRKEDKLLDQRPEETRQEEPVTMAVAGDPAVASGASRWTAVSVAIDSNEAAISLDHEMQKAYAALEGADITVAAAQEIAQAPAANSTAPAESAIEAISNSESEFKQPENAVATEKIEPEPVPAAQSAVTDDIRSFTAAESVNPPQSLRANPEPVAAVDSVQPDVEASHVISASTESSAPIPESSISAVEDGGGEADRNVHSSQELPGTQADTLEAAPAPSASLEPVVNESQPELDTQIDTETVKSTAAAWASWRQVRDTSKDNYDVAATQPRQFDAPQSVPDQSVPEETNAKAVAAGAEQYLQVEALSDSNSKPSDVASIVDSVLADLRPKLMEEISRKMAEKK